MQTKMIPFSVWLVLSVSWGLGCSFQTLPDSTSETSETSDPSATTILDATSSVTTSATPSLAETLPSEPVEATESESTQEEIPSTPQPGDPRCTAAATKHDECTEEGPELYELQCNGYLVDSYVFDYDCGVAMVAATECLSTIDCSDYISQVTCSQELLALASVCRDWEAVELCDTYGQNVGGCETSGWEALWASERCHKDLQVAAELSEPCSEATLAHYTCLSALDCEAVAAGSGCAAEQSTRDETCAATTEN